MNSPPVARRATVLVSADPARSWDVTSDDPDDAGVGPVRVGDVLVDPDAAVVRAHLVRHYAARHGLSLLDPHLAYLAGPAVPPGVRGFRVLDAAPYREKTVAGWARRDGIGTLEIKQRGTPVIPDDLRRRLRPALTGPTTAAATLVIARIGNGRAGVLVPGGGSQSRVSIRLAQFAAIRPVESMVRRVCARDIRTSSRC